MATTTTNIGLRKPAKSDYVNVETDIGDNMDLIDSAVNSTEKAVAIIADGNTHVAVSAGEYLYVRNHLSLEEGLYRATEAIAQNGTLTSSNTTAITNGLGGQVSVLNTSVGKIKRAGRGGTSSSTGVFSFTMENSTSALVMINANVIGMYVTAGGVLYNATLPSGYTVTRSGTTVTITKTTSVSTIATVSYMVISG